MSRGCRDAQVEGGTKITHRPRRSRRRAGDVTFCVQAAAAAEAALAAAPVVAQTACVSILKFTAEHELELSFEEGEELTVLGVPTPDGWVMGQNAAGLQGLVPETYLVERKVERQGSDDSSGSAGSAGGGASEAAAALAPAPAADGPSSSFKGAHRRTGSTGSIGSGGIGSGG